LFNSKSLATTTLVLGCSLAQANDVVPLTSTEYARERTLQAIVTCTYTPELVEGHREGLILDPAIPEPKKRTVLGTATIIKFDGHVVTSKHLFDSFKEEQGSYTDELGEIRFRYVCKEEDIQITFQDRNKNLFEEAPNSRNLSERYDVVMTKFLRGNSGLFSHYCYSNESIENSPKNGLPIYNFGFAYLKYDKKNPTPETFFTGNGGYVKTTTGPTLQHGVIQMTQNTIKGMSGGPVVDHNNRLIGINKGFRRLDPENRSTLERNFFVPIQKFNQFLRENGENNCGLDDDRHPALTTTTPTNPAISDEECINKHLASIDSTRIEEIETGSGSLTIIGSHQTKKKPFSLIMRENRQLLGAVTLNFFAGSDVFKVASIIDNKCQKIESFSNASRRSNKSTLQNWDTLEVKINGKIYHLRIGHDSSEVSVNYFREVVE